MKRSKQRVRRLAILDVDAAVANSKEGIGELPVQVKRATAESPENPSGMMLWIRFRRALGPAFAATKL